MLDINSKKSIRLISTKYSIKDIMEQSGYSTNAKMVICPFHEDEHPSAKFYEDDDDGIVKLFCFGCKRQFSSYDYFKQFDPGKLQFLLSDIKDIDKVKEAVFETDFSVLNKFKKKEVSLQEYLKIVFNL